MSLRWDVLAIVFPRLCLVALNVSQPFLINEAVVFIEAPDNVESNNIGYGLIGAFSFVYIGTAVSQNIPFE
jgi:ATP-binding cassette, subfamily C (CFTR/MRP), member 1